MTHLRFLFIFSFTVIVNSGPVHASEFGTPEEARVMLERAVAALQKDKSAALEAFNKKDGGYRDRDLYVFCAGPDGIFSAHPKVAGKWNLKSYVDVAGKPVGEEMFEIARERGFSEVAYLLNREGEPGPRKKTSLVTKVGDQVCGVGYFNPDEPTPTSDKVVSGYEGVFIYGYDPVAYFTMDEAVKGSADFTYEYLGGEWHFVSDQHRQMFVAEPAKYIPQHGGYCSSAASGGQVFSANPRAWRIIDGKLYLFASNRVRKDYVPDAALDAGWQQKLMELVSQ